MKTYIKYPPEIEKMLVNVFPYRNEIRSMLVDYGYKPNPNFDLMLLQFKTVFESMANNENRDNGFFDDLWKIVKKSADAVTGVVKGLGDGAKEVLKGLGGKLGGNSNSAAYEAEIRKEAEETKKKTLLYVGLGGAAIILILIILKFKK